jgi:hypothetical protein
MVDITSLASNGPPQKYHPQDVHGYEVDVLCQKSVFCAKKGVLCQKVCFMPLGMLERGVGQTNILSILTPRYGPLHLRLTRLISSMRCILKGQGFETLVTSGGAIGGYRRLPPSLGIRAE